MFPTRCLFSFPGLYKASEARLLLLMYQVNYVTQGGQLKDSAISPAKIVDDSWTMDGFVSLSGRGFQLRSDEVTLMSISVVI